MARRPGLRETRRGGDRPVCANEILVNEYRPLPSGLARRWLFAGRRQLIIIFRERSQHVARGGVGQSLRSVTYLFGAGAIAKRTIRVGVHESVSPKPSPD